MQEDELLAAVVLLMNPPDDVDLDYLEELESKFEQAIPHPAGVDLINYPSVWGYPSGLTAEQVVHIATSWPAKVLAMQVVDLPKHPQLRSNKAYTLSIPGQLQIQVVSPEVYQVGDVCAVALSRTTLASGEVVSHGYVEKAFSAGRILGRTNASVGSTVEA
jgi:hypothetical protein